MKISIRQKLLIFTLGVILTLLTTITVVHIAFQRGLFQEELDRRIALMKDSLTARGKTLAANIGRYTENAIAAYDFFGIAQTLEKSVHGEKDLAYGILMDYEGVAHIHTKSPRLLETKLTSKADRMALTKVVFSTYEYEEEGRAYIEFITPIHIGDIPWGVMRLGFSTDRLKLEISESRNRMKNRLQDLLGQSVGVMCLFVIIAMILVQYGALRITTPLRQLTDFSRKLTESGFKADIPIEVARSNDEIGELAETFDRMARRLKESYDALDEYSTTLEEQVDERTSELNKKNEDLIETLNQLRETQNQLIQSAKMASLGQLVAGMAHEINTPIGIGVTAASFLHGEIEKLLELMKQEEVEEEDLVPLMNRIEESGKLILSNLNRASELISSFKQTSADQTSQGKRVFDVRQVVSDTIVALKPELKKTSVNVSLDNLPSIKINSFPGALSQIITNLVINSLTHGFDLGERGEILIEGEKKEHNVFLRYGDSGKGIEEELLKIVFDPFVTTNRGGGGTGLGLYIVFNIVNKVLGGEISCHSDIGKGTNFCIIIPTKTYEVP